MRGPEGRPSGAVCNPRLAAVWHRVSAPGSTGPGPGAPVPVPHLLGGLGPVRPGSGCLPLWWEPLHPRAVHSNWMAVGHGSRKSLELPREIKIIWGNKTQPSGRIKPPSRQHGPGSLAQGQQHHKPAPTKRLPGLAVREAASR